MKQISSTGVFLPAFLVAFFFILLLPVHSANKQTTAPAINIEDIAPEEVDSVLAKLSDEQVRSMLLVELSKAAPSRSLANDSPGGLFGFTARWIHSMDKDPDQKLENRVEMIVSHTSRVPGDLSQIFRKVGDGSSMASAWKNFIGIFLIFLAASGVELLFKTLIAPFRRQLIAQSVPDLSAFMRLWAGAMQEIPAILYVAAYGAASFLLFFLTPMSDFQGARLLFMAILFSIIFVRIGAMLAHLFCSPEVASLRLLPLSDAAAGKFHKVIVLFLLFVGIGMSFLVLINGLGIPRQTFDFLIMLLGTILLLLVVIIVARSRQAITGYILSGDTVDAGSSWVMGQFASLWHVPALLYLFMVWIIFIFQQTMGIRQGENAFLLSLLVVPLFLVLDRIAQWVVRMAISTLKIYPVAEGEDATHDKNQDEFTPQQKERLLVIRVGRIVRIAVLIALIGWVMSLWGYDLLYAEEITIIIFKSLVTLILALFFWRIVSDYLERKITESEPEKEEKKEEVEEVEEFGAAAQRGRGYTLFPMVRKFLGSVLLVMVTLILLSTIGIEIGPLLAGAGVVGLAIGFGARKLVSDIFSGFFFLLDDAFRLGEYLQAGKVEGAVEAITLRNVMLRHHRGMLQIIPYSDLGPITNFMRGGIVVKFNLEFPYDTDIDQVRRIIKKVGQAMLEDEEFGNDFISPLKSQGVREIANSVMVIRFKFTAKPGTHFLIRREAYRLISDALAAKGIHYAHRKVIVEVPAGSTVMDEQGMTEAGAAAGVTVMAAETRKTSNSHPSIPKG